MRLFWSSRVKLHYAVSLRERLLGWWNEAEGGNSAYLLQVLSLDSMTVFINLSEMMNPTNQTGTNLPMIAVGDPDVPTRHHSLSLDAPINFSEIAACE